MKLGNKMKLGVLAAAISLGGLGLGASGCAGASKTVKAEEKSCGGKTDGATEAGGETEAGTEKSCGAGSCGAGSCGG